MLRGSTSNDNPWPPFRHAAWAEALAGVAWTMVVLHPTLEEVERRASKRRGEPAQGDRRLAAMHGAGTRPSLRLWDLGVADERRQPFDLAAYVDRVRSSPCFICRIADGTHDQPTHIVYRDNRHIVFLPNFHVLHGYALVAPLEHREAVASDFTEAEYLDLQALLRRVALALEEVVPAERIYVLSLGSADGNAHVHWHVAALPPGVPYEEQQFRALMAETAGVLDLTNNDQAALAGALQEALLRIES